MAHKAAASKHATTTKRKNIVFQQIFSVQEKSVEGKKSTQETNNMFDICFLFTSMQVEPNLCKITSFGEMIFKLNTFTSHFFQSLYRKSRNKFYYLLNFPLFCQHSQFTPSSFPKFVQFFFTLAFPCRICVYVYVCASLSQRHAAEREVFFYLNTSTGYSIRGLHKDIDLQHATD